MSSIWKGIRSIVNISIKHQKKDIMIVDSNRKKITDKKIPKPLKKFNEYLGNIHVGKSFFLNPASPQEIFDIILSYDIKRSLGPNSRPIYILKISNNFLPDVKADINEYLLKQESFQTSAN